MIAFLHALVAVLPSWARPIANPLIDRLIAIWRWSESLARRVRGGWEHVTDALRQWRTGAVNLAAETYTTLRHLILVRIPARVADALAKARSVAAGLVNAARAGLAVVIDRLDRWVKARLAEAFAALAGLRTWAAGLLGGLRTDMREVLRRLGGYLATPERLAAWLAGAMWSALWRYGYGRLDAIAEAIWRRRAAIALRAAADIERTIGRML